MSYVISNSDTNLCNVRLNKCVNYSTKYDQWVKFKYIDIDEKKKGLRHTIKNYIDKNNPSIKTKVYLEIVVNGKKILH